MAAEHDEIRAGLNGRVSALSPTEMMRLDLWARQDAILAVLRDAEGFPLSTGQIARALGMKQIGHDWRGGQSPCHRCGRWHAPPVWREVDAQDIRGLLNRMAKAELVEKIVLESQRHHYWRASLSGSSAGGEQ